jgi:hypothetical protein
VPLPAGSVELMWAAGAQTELVSPAHSARPGTTLYVEEQLLDSTTIEHAFVADAEKEGHSRCSDDLFGLSARYG